MKGQESHTHRWLGFLGLLSCVGDLLGRHSAVLKALAMMDDNICSHLKLNVLLTLISQTLMLKNYRIFF